MKKRIYFRSERLKFIAWAVIPFFVLACSCAKTVQNKEQKTVDTLIITRTDTTLRDALRKIYDNTRESVRTHDSVAYVMMHDTVVKEIWHREVVERLREVQVTDSAGTKSKVRDGTYKSRDSMETETKETEKQMKQGRSVILWVMGAVMVLILIVLIYDIRSRHKIQS